MVVNIGRDSVWWLWTSTPVRTHVSGAVNTDKCEEKKKKNTYRCRCWRADSDGCVHACRGVAYVRACVQTRMSIYIYKEPTEADSDVVCRCVACTRV